MKLKDSTSEKLNDDQFADYILRPRVDFEMLTPYRASFTEALGVKASTAFRTNPLLLVEKLDQEFDVIPEINYYRGSATPAGSFQLKKGDAPSRDILFVAIARSIGIPARLDPSDKRPQFFKDGVWQQVQFQDSQTEADRSTAKAIEPTSTISFQADAQIQYFKNFTIARFSEGFYDPYFISLTKAEKIQLELPIGHYRITASTRLKDGTTLLKLYFFEVIADTDRLITFTFPIDESVAPVLASASLNYEVEAADGRYKPFQIILEQKARHLFGWNQTVSHLSIFFVNYEK